MRVHFISDLATPHVNTILASLAEQPGIDLDLWYSAETLPGFPVWKSNPTHAIRPARLFGTRVPNAALIRHTLSRPEDKVIVVGWANPTTRALIPLLDARRRKFAFFTDEPVEVGGRGVLRRALRAHYVGVLRRRATVLATGVNAVRHFVELGVPPSRVLDAPIPTLVPAGLDRLRASRQATRARYGVPDDALMVVAGSRFIPTKGFDLLIKAVAWLTGDERRRVRVLLVGSGPEEAALKSAIAQHGIGDVFDIRSWMELTDLEAAFAAADVAVHPARFDGYGATSLMALGIGLPVIGTRTAGAAAELIVPGQNGFLYDAEDVDALCNHLRAFIRDPQMAVRMGRESAKLAERWSPRRVADVFLTALRSLE